MAISREARSDDRDPWYDFIFVRVLLLRPNKVLRRNIRKPLCTAKLCTGAVSRSSLGVGELSLRHDPGAAAPVVT